LCGAPQVDDEDANSLINPIMVVEVLSPSTEAYDRGAKLAHYRAIPSLRAVLLVPQDTQRLELFAKRDDGQWELYERTDGELPIDALGITVNVEDIYRAPLLG